MTPYLKRSFFRMDTHHHITAPSLRQRSSHQDGLTLIEVVIAILILTVMMGSAYNGMTYLQRTRQLILDEQEMQKVSSSVIDRLTQEIELASAAGSPLMPPCGENSKVQGRNVYFSSTPAGSTVGPHNALSSMRFIAPGIGQALPDGIRNSGSVQVEYRVVKDPEDPSLLALVREELPLIKPNELACRKRLTFTITKKIVSLRFEFFDFENNRWLPSWGDEATTNLPGIVFLELKLRSSKGVEKKYTTAIYPRATS